MRVAIMANDKTGREQVLKSIQGTITGKCVMGNKTQILEYLITTTPDAVLIGGSDLAGDASVINQVRTLLAKAGCCVSTRMLGMVGDLVLITTRRMQ